MERISLVGLDGAFKTERYFFLHFCTEWELFLKAGLQRGEIELRRAHPTGIGNSVSVPITFHSPQRERGSKGYFCAQFKRRVALELTVAF